MKKKIFLLKANIVYNREVFPEHFSLRVRLPKGRRIGAQPGQFFHVRVAEAGPVLLRRPFSIHGLSQQRDTTFIDFLYRVKGQGTALLSQRRPGESLDFLGPLGRGFSLPAAGVSVTPLLVAGGIGIAPLFFLAQRLSQGGLPKQAIQPWVLWGAPGRQGLFCLRELRRLGCRVKVATEDGTLGFAGKVTGLFREFLYIHNKGRPPPGTGWMVYACGPQAMLRQIVGISRAHKIAVQVSVEERMACGVGACGGCALPTHAGMKRVCSNGPVFFGEEIVW